MLYRHYRINAANFLNFVGIIILVVFFCSNLWAGGKAKTKAKSKKSPKEISYPHVFDNVKAMGQKLARKMSSLDGSYNRLVVLPFKTNHKTDNSQGLALSHLLTETLKKQKGIILLEREKLAQILEEMAFSQTGAVDEKTAPRLGKILGARAMVSGSLYQLDNKYLLSVRLIDAEKATILLQESSSFPVKSLNQSLESILVYKSRTGAIWRSALFPGIGQLYMGETERAITYTSLASLSLVSSIFFYLRASSERKQYREDEPATVRYYDWHKNSINNHKLSLGIFALTYLVNMADILFTARDKVEYLPINIEVSNQQTAVSFRYKF